MGGSDIVAAGYCMYGAATELVLCFKGQSVQRFALDPSLGEFVHTHSNVTFPAGGGKKIYSCNEGNFPYWDQPIKDAVTEFKAKKYALRYVGSMVSDVHRTILYGGVFVYPADKKSPKGKLRVLYEGFPMALLVEAAGDVDPRALPGHPRRRARRSSCLSAMARARSRRRCPRRRSRKHASSAVAVSA